MALSYTPCVPILSGEGSASVKSRLNMITWWVALLNSLLNSLDSSTLCPKP